MSHATTRTGSKHSPLFFHLDKYISIKKNYLFLRHLVPLSIASLMLLTLSVPTDNLLLKLTKLLQHRSWMWIPAIIVTALSTIVYMLTIKSQVRKLYLLSEYIRRRTVVTSIVYIILSTLMAIAVLKSISSCTSSLGDIWACFMIAVLSLTGIGWSGPTSWYESIAVRAPNYDEAHVSIEELITILARVRKKGLSTKEDIENTLEKVKGLQSHIEKNLRLEPKWAKHDLSEISTELLNLITDIKDSFLSGDSLAIRNFASACKLQVEMQYPKTVKSLKFLGRYWPNLIELS